MPKGRDAKNDEKRERLWPGSTDEIFRPKRGTVGYSRVPRVLSLACRLINEKRASSPGKLYTVLWCHDWGEAIVEVRDEESMVFEAGYSGRRARRTWRDHIGQLEEDGWIRVKPTGNRKIGVILLRDPHLVIAEQKLKGEVTPAFYNAFAARCEELSVPLKKIESKAVVSVRKQAAAAKATAEAKAAEATVKKEANNGAE